MVEGGNGDAPIRPKSFLGLPIAEPHARAAAIFVNELYAGMLKCDQYFIYRFCPAATTDAA
jgi:hypothetical protein